MHGEDAEDAILPKESLLKILIATDCHLGYEESDPVISEDSFVTFEEVLTQAVDEDVDFILLGGDLFHHNNPSQKTMNKCIQLLRQYTLGSKDIKFELLSKASDIFSNGSSQTANFLDENINISIPVFSIHGNHDDPSGLGQYSSLDTLASAGLVNYFGKWTDLEGIQIKPIVIRKGRTYLALYGLSYIKDDRLARLFIDNKVTFLEPEVEAKSAFRVLILHQNRVERGPKRYVSESFIPSFFNLIIWGHEHDCRITPQENMEKGFKVVQPGSTVATSLCEGEAEPKHIGVLKLWEDYAKFIPLKLCTVRPFVWKSVQLWEVDVDPRSESKSEEIKAHCVNEVEGMIEEAKNLLTGHPKQPKLPLIRLRCEYTDESQLFNIVKFGQLFMKRVATPNLEVVRLKKVTEHYRKQQPSDRQEVIKKLKELYGDEQEDNQGFTECVNQIVNEYFTQNADARMTVLRVKEMGTAVEKFIDKDETDVISNLVDRKMSKLMKEMAEHRFENEEDVLKELERIRDEEEKLAVKEDKEYNAKFEDKVGKQKPAAVVADSDSGTDEYDVDEANLPAGPARKSTPDLNVSDDRLPLADSDSDSDKDVPDNTSPPDSGRGRGKGSRGRGRGRGQGRGRSTSVTTRAPKKSSTTSSWTAPKTDSKKPLKFTVTNSVMYEDDSDDD